MQRNGTRTQKTTMASTIGKYTGKNMQRDVKWREMARYFSFHFIHGMCEPGSVCSNDDVPFFHEFFSSLSRFAVHTGLLAIFCFLNGFSSCNVFLQVE